MDESSEFDDALLDAAEASGKAVSASAVPEADDLTAAAFPPAEGDDAVTTRLGRRGIMAGLALSGVAVVAGGTGALAASQRATGGFRREQFAVDIACLGNTLREGARRGEVEAADEAAPFTVEGWIYESGTIPDGNGWNPVEVGSIGRWFCRGWLLISKLRTEPHAGTNVDLLFGTITDERVFPPDTLAVQGIEGTDDRRQFALRPVVGGTGKYVGATGQITQWVLGLNATDFPNWRYEIDIRVWD